MIFIVKTNERLSETEIESLPYVEEAINIGGFDHVQQVADAAIAGESIQN